MNGYTLYLPTKFLIGNGKLDLLGEQATKLGKKAFVIMDPFLKNGSVAKRVLELLNAAGIDAAEWYDVVPNPRCFTVDKAAEEARTGKCDFVVAIGGGSTLDSAKAICLVAKHGGTSWEYTRRVGENRIIPTEPGLPLLAVPTTAGTGSEVTPFAVLSNPDVKLKATISPPSLDQAVSHPTISIIDPELHLSMPKSLTASTGLDTFAHAFEAYISVRANEWTDMYALKAIKLFAENIEECYQNGSNLGARGRMAEACLMAASALAHVGVALPHAIGQALGALKDAPHGAAIAACTRQTVEWTLPAAEERFAAVAEVIDPSVAGASVTERAFKLPEILATLYAKIGMNETLGSLGLKADEVEQLTDIAFRAYGGDVARHPKEASKKDVAQIVRNSL